MSYCPKCNFLYKTKMIRCPDCSELLINDTQSIHRGAVAPDSSWVVIGDIGDEGIADLVQGTLESSNIPSMFVDLKEGDNAAHVASLLNDKQVEPNRSIIIVPNEYKQEAVFLLSEILDDELEKYQDREIR